MADTITLNNAGSNAWEATSSSGTNISVDTTVENPVINLSNIGTRYIFYNDGYSAHPLEFLDSNGDILLSQSGTGTFESDGSVNWVDNDTSVEFTLTTELSDQITQYRCTVHTTAMAAPISSPQTVDYTPSTGSVSITSPDNSSTVVNPFPVSMEATNFVIESASNGVSDGAGHFHLLVDQPAVTAGEVIPNNPSNGYYHYGDGSTSTELDLSTGEHTIRLQAGDANHRAYNLTDSIGVTVTTVSGSIDTLAKPDKGTPNWHIPLNDNFSKLETSSGSINSTSDGVQIDNPVTNNPFVKFNVSNDGSSNGTLVLANSSIDANNNSITNVDGISVGTLNADNLANNTTESVQDVVGGLITGQNDANVTYDDTTDQLSIDVSTLTNEQVEDIVSSLVSSGSNLSWSYNDSADTLSVSLNDSISVNDVEATNSITDASGITHSGQLADSNDISSIQLSSDVDHDSTIGGTDSDAHHTKTSSGEIDHDSTIGGTDSDAHHSKYTDNDARSALKSTGRVGGSGLFFDFNNSNDYIELVDGNNNRDELVTEDVYFNNGGVWLGDDHIGVSNAHHNKTTSSDINHDATIGGTDSNAHHNKTTSGDVTVTDTQVGSLADGEFLQNSSGSLTGATPTAGLEPITEATASNDAEVVLSMMSGYDSYIVEVSDLSPEGGTYSPFRLQFSTDGGSSFVKYGSKYPWVSQEFTKDGIDGTDGSEGASSMGLGPATVGSYEIKIVNPNDSSAYTHLNARFESVIDRQNAGVVGGGLNQKKSVNAVRFFYEFDNIATGTFRLWGVN